jgi:hypothetical protein
LHQLDDFIELINIIRSSLLAVSVSAILLAPLSIALSLYMVQHPSFYNVLESKDEFGYVLASFLGIVITISSTWLVIGIKRYESTNSWNTRYQEYLQEWLSACYDLKQSLFMHRQVAYVNTAIRQKLLACKQKSLLKVEATIAFVAKGFDDGQEWWR